MSSLSGIVSIVPCTCVWLKVLLMFFFFFSVGFCIRDQIFQNRLEIQRSNWRYEWGLIFRRCWSSSFENPGYSRRLQLDNPKWKPSKSLVSFENGSHSSWAVTGEAEHENPFRCTLKEQSMSGLDVLWPPLSQLLCTSVLLSYLNWD